MKFEVRLLDQPENSMCVAAIEGNQAYNFCFAYPFDRPEKLAEFLEIGLNELMSKFKDKEISHE